MDTTVKNRFFEERKGKGKGKAIPIQAWTCPMVSRRLKVPKFPDNRHMKLVRFADPCTGRLYSFLF
jgi:hypothetical protein